MRYPNRWTIGEWTFYEVDDHGFGGPSEGRSLYTYSGEGVLDSRGAPKTGELYHSLDHAMAAAIAAKHTGERGAGGTGVGTAADWFMRMIGAGQIQEAGPAGARALMEAVRDNADKPMAAHRIERALEDQGYVLARQAIG